MNKYQIEFINRAFDANCLIKINSNNEIIHIDNFLQRINLVTSMSKENDELFEYTIYELLAKNVKNTPLFINSLKMCVDHKESFVTAVSSDINITSRLAIPCIYLFLVTINYDNDTQTRTINFYNLIEVSRKMQNLFITSIAPSTLSIAQNIRPRLKKKSLYFAFEALKPIAGFIEENQLQFANSYYLVDLIKNFHATAKQQNDKLYKHRLFKENGYIEINKNQYLCELSQEMIKTIISMPLVPFNQLSENVLINI